jgi:hypothetical protein
MGLKSSYICPEKLMTERELNPIHAAVTVKLKVRQQLIFIGNLTHINIKFDD